MRGRIKQETSKLFATDLFTRSVPEFFGNALQSVRRFPGFLYSKVAEKCETLWQHFGRNFTIWHSVHLNRARLRRNPKDNNIDTAMAHSLAMHMRRAVAISYGNDSVIYDIDLNIFRPEGSVVASSYVANSRDVHGVPLVNFSDLIDNKWWRLFNALHFVNLILGVLKGLCLGGIDAIDRRFFLRPGSESAVQSSLLAKSLKGSVHVLAAFVDTFAKLPLKIAGDLLDAAFDISTTIGFGVAHGALRTIFGLFGIVGYGIKRCCSSSNTVQVIPPAQPVVVTSGPSEHDEKKPEKSISRKTAASVQTNHSAKLLSRPSNASQVVPVPVAASPVPSMSRGRRVPSSNTVSEVKKRRQSHGGLIASKPPLVKAGSTVRPVSAKLARHKPRVLNRSQTFDHLAVDKILAQIEPIPTAQLTIRIEDQRHLPGQPSPSLASSVHRINTDSSAMTVSGSPQLISMVGQPVSDLKALEDSKGELKDHKDLKDGKSPNHGSSTSRFSKSFVKGAGLSPRLPEHGRLTGGRVTFAAVGLAFRPSEEVRTALQVPAGFVSVPGQVESPVPSPQSDAIQPVRRTF